MQDLAARATANPNVFDLGSQTRGQLLSEQRGDLRAVRCVRIDIHGDKLIDFFHFITYRVPRKTRFFRDCYVSAVLESSYTLTTVR